MKAIEVKAPKDYKDIEDLRFSVFLAGSIDQGRAIEWQQKLVEELANFEILILNPRRDDWDFSWEADNPKFEEQIEWELAAQEDCDLILFVFTYDSKSPVTMLELGLFAMRNDSIVLVEEGYYRQGNIDIFCKRYNIPIYHEMNKFVQAVRLFLIREGV
jgi:nucleoside 2-deoxyribosyltransferase-like protein